MLDKKTTRTISLVITEEDLKKIDYIKDYESEFDEKEYTRSDAIRIAIREYAHFSGYNNSPA